jgi:diphthine-ammonia ligase
MKNAKEGLIGSKRRNEMVTAMKSDGIARGNVKGNVVVSWTGGKDGCYSCYKAMEDGYQVTHLLNFRNIKKTGSHEINQEIIRAQSEAIGIPLIQRDFFSYEEEFKKVVLGLRAQGAKIDGAVFGHIQTHKMLVDRICQDVDLDLLLPIWKQDSEKVLREIIDSGFEAFVVSVKDGLLGKEWLGRRIDEDFINDLRGLDEHIDPCGEDGEFHTLVTDGPIFKKKIKIVKSEPILKEGYWFLNIIADKSCEKTTHNGA